MMKKTILPQNSMQVEIRISVFVWYCFIYTPLNKQDAAIGEVLQSIKGMKKGLVLLD
jgi:hypothetical protein